MSIFLSPLDHVLTNRGKVRLLRALMPLSRPVSGREAAKLARLSQTPALRALEDLVTMGVLRRTETPSQYLYEVNRTHQLAREGLEPLFQAERERIGRVLDTLRSVLRQDSGRIASAAVFGSAACGQDLPGSDFDVLVVTKNDSDVDLLHGRLADTIPRMVEEFGLELSPVVLPLSRFREMHRNGDSLVADVLREARMITGERPEALVHG
jgi:predicted nucleotidyltransferase